MRRVLGAAVAPRWINHDHPVLPVGGFSGSARIASTCGATFSLRCTPLTAARLSISSTERPILLRLGFGCFADLGHFIQGAPAYTSTLAHLVT